MAGVDPNTGVIVRLYHPRQDQWNEHFRYQESVLIGKTDIGRTTIGVLAINLPIRVAARAELIKRGIAF